MTSGMTSGYSTRRTITAFFDTRSDAEEAVSRLQTADIAPESIRLIPGTERDTDAPRSPRSACEHRVVGLAARPLPAG